MRDLLDLVGVAVGGLTARFSRTLLIMLGPIIGVSAIVAAVGLTESAKGDLQQTLAALGDNLIRAEAAASFGSSEPTFPEDVVDRITALRTVEGATAALSVSGVITTPYAAAEDYYTAFPTPVLAADENFLDVMQVKMVSGRWLNSFDSATAARSAVVGVGLADEFGYVGGQRTIRLNGIDYGVVGVVERYPLDSQFDNAVIIPPETADRDFDAGLEPNLVFVRSDPAHTLTTQDALSVAIGLGGDVETTTVVLSDALEAEAAADSTLQIIVAAMGLLALVVGGVGIANVMSISVLQRSAEIGIRRALGHGRVTIAGQFLLEAIVVGLLGGLAGAALGIGIVVFSSRIAGWVHVLAPELDLFGVALPSHTVGLPTLYVIGVGAALITSVLAGLYPSVKAARLEPLETLRLG